jgi:endonuclease YncB( thermonuclease family)
MVGVVSVVLLLWGVAQGQKPDQQLLAATFSNTPEFIAMVPIGKVLKVYDGDTITIAGRIGNTGNLYRFSVRLNGIDTPEIKGQTEGEKKIAAIARDFVAGKIMDKVVTLSNIEMEKYGRLLADVTFDKENIAQSLIKACLAVKYDGGTKASVDWEALYAKCKK